MDSMTVNELRQRAFLTRELAGWPTFGVKLRQQLRITAMHDEAVAGAIEDAEKKRGW